MSRDRRHQPAHPRFLLPVLVFLIVIGVVSIALTLQQGREAALARAEQVEETTRLVEDLTAQFAGRVDDATVQRAVICEIVHDIASDRGLTPPECIEVQG